MSSLDESVVAGWREHIGRQEVRQQRLDIEGSRRFAAAIGASTDVRQHLPPLGHWAYFVEVAPPDQIGADGHPKRGGLMPPVTLPRRMFASAITEFQEPLALDDNAELTISIVDVRHRTGKTGDLVFVDVDRRLDQNGRTRLTERQTIVYRDVGDPVPPVSPSAEAPAADACWTPNEVDLLRFSAATFNSHRIHYDWPYATAVEGYPGLVVHGPFTAARLYALAQSASPTPMRRFEFRALAPLFVGQPIYLVRGEDEVRAVRCDGATAMTARASF